MTSTVNLPQGFRAAGVTAGLKASGRSDLALVVNDGPDHHAAAVFTSNRVEAAPVTWSRQVVSDGRVDAVVHVATAESGTVGDLLRTPGVRLLGVERVQALTRAQPTLRPILIPQGALMGQVGDAAVTAPLAGMVRGLLQDGLQVSARFKIGDIDPRGAKADYLTASDKAMAIAGGVLEAMLRLRLKATAQNAQVS